MLNLMLCGCQGKMGRVIEECTLTRGDCRIAAGIDLNTEEKRDFPVYASPADCKEAMDAIIDFSHPNSLNGLLAYAKTHKTPLVIATTGYSKEQIDQIHEAAREIPLFFTFNMSLGVNLLADLARRATAVLGDQFDIEIIEKHHNRKLDAPSGTALMLADAISEELAQPPQYVYDRHSRRAARSKEEIGIHSVRGGTIVGEHEIMFAGKDEILSISHSAASREVFAVGAIRAALFMKDRPAGFYDMGSMIG